MCEVYWTYFYSITSKVKHGLGIGFIVYRLEYLGKELLAVKTTEKGIYRLSIGFFVYATIYLLTAIIVRSKLLTIAPLFSITAFGLYYVIAGIMYLGAIDFWLGTYVSIQNDKTTVKIPGARRSRQFAITDYSKIRIKETLRARLAATWTVQLVTIRKYIEIYRGQSKEFAMQVAELLSPLMGIPIETHYVKNLRKKKVYNLTARFGLSYFLVIPFMLLSPSLFPFIFLYTIIGFAFFMVLLILSWYYLDK